MIAAIIILWVLVLLEGWVIIRLSQRLKQERIQARHELECTLKNHANRCGVRL